MCESDVSEAGGIERWVLTSQLAVLGYQHNTLKEPCEWSATRVPDSARLTKSALLGLNWYTEETLQHK